MRDASFVDNIPLREKIVDVLRDILDLSGMIEEQDKERTKSCLRKTMIIYLTSVIEALLLWKIQKEIDSEKITLSDKIKYYDPQQVHRADGFDLFVVKGKQETKKLTELDFNRMIGICGKHNCMRNKKLIDNLHKVRKTRNELHIGGLKAIRKIYNRNDVNSIFDVLEQTIKTIM